MEYFVFNGVFRGLPLRPVLIGLRGLPTSRTAITVTPVCSCFRGRPVDGGWYVIEPCSSRW